MARAADAVLEGVEAAAGLFDRDFLPDHFADGAATRYGFDDRGHFTGHFRPSEPRRGVTRMPAGRGGLQPTATGCLTTEGVRIVTSSSPAVG